MRNRRLKQIMTATHKVGNKALALLMCAGVGVSCCGCDATDTNNYGDPISDSNVTIDTEQEHIAEYNSKVLGVSPMVNNSESVLTTNLVNTVDMAGGNIVQLNNLDFGGTDESATSMPDVDLNLEGYGDDEGDTNKLQTRYNSAGIAVKTITGISGIAFDIPKGYTYRESGDRYSIYIDDTKITVDYRKNVSSIKGYSAENNLGIFQLPAPTEAKEDDKGKDKEQIELEKTMKATETDLMQCGLNYIVKDMVYLYTLGGITNITPTDMYDVNGISMMDFNIDIVKVFIDVSSKRKEPIRIEGVVHLTVAKNADGIYLMSYISEDETGGAHENVLRNMLTTIRKNGNASDAWREAFYVEYLKSSEKDKGKYEGRLISRDLISEESETLLIEYLVTQKDGKIIEKSMKVEKPEKFNEIYLDFVLDVGTDCKLVEVVGVTHYNGWLEDFIDVKAIDYDLLNALLEAQFGDDENAVEVPAPTDENGEVIEKKDIEIDEDAIDTNTGLGDFIS